ncbi:MAG: hypothetical protein ABJQ69_03760 [Ekhidna sp.]
MSTVSVDLFGYEKNVTKNVIKYFEKVSVEQCAPVSQLFIRIYRESPGTVRVFLHQNGKILKEIPVGELVCFFAGEGISKLLGIELKVIDSVSRYLEEFAKANEMHLDQLCILISYNQKQVEVNAYNRNKHEQDIPLIELVKYFKP